LEGRNEGRKEGRKKGRKEGRNEKRKEGREVGREGGIELGSGLVTTNGPRPDESDLGGAQLYFCFDGEFNRHKIIIEIKNIVHKSPYLIVDIKNEVQTSSSNKASQRRELSRTKASRGRKYSKKVDYRNTARFSGPTGAAQKKSSKNNN